jgi:uncharacterized surface protein with fasciclin (FAS1) repeats
MVGIRNSRLMFTVVALMGLFVLIAGCAKKEPPKTETPPATEQPVLKDIVATATEAGTFNTLVKALQAGELVQALQAPGPFTVFAPTDEAFAALPAGALDKLLKPENKAKLADLLKYHVVSGKIAIADVKSMTSVMTALEGKEIKISVQDDVLLINDAHVIKSDIECSNGVIHVIDKVLTP